jgi:hypothetical protein
MSDYVSPSPVIDCFARNLEGYLPDDQKAKLEKYGADIAASTSEDDQARAVRCAKWAMEASSDKSASHPRWKEVKEAHKLWGDTWFGVGFGLEMPLDTIGDDVRTQWTENTVGVIRSLAEEDGWEKSQWPELLTELIALKK